jgi:hypothetical protein
MTAATGPIGLEPALRPAGPGVRMARVAAGQIEGVVHQLVTGEQARLADLFGTVEEDGLVLRVVSALDHRSEYRVLEWVCDTDRYPQLSDVAPAAFVEECEIYEQFQVRPTGGKALNRVVAPPHLEPAGSRPGWPRHREASPVHAPHYVAGEAFEFPVGPVRGVGQESLYLGLVTSGEELVDLYLLQWHKHRGLERRLEGLSPERALFFVERAEGLSAVGNGLAFCRAVVSGGRLVPCGGGICRPVAGRQLERGPFS